MPEAPPHPHPPRIVPPPLPASQQQRAIAKPAQLQARQGPPTMLDVFCGPNAPLACAFHMCGWRILKCWDRLITASDDLLHVKSQQELDAQVTEADFINVAMDCSTKSRIREIPRKFDDGRPCPKPLRSESHPEGVPGLRGADKDRVEADNTVCLFVLGLLQRHAEKGGVSIRENPERSLHWWMAQEFKMMETDFWRDQHYASCVLSGFRCKRQKLRYI